MRVDSSAGSHMPLRICLGFATTMHCHKHSNTMITEGQVRISSPIQKKASAMDPPLFYELCRQCRQKWLYLLHSISTLVLVSVCVCMCVCACAFSPVLYAWRMKKEDNAEECILSSTDKIVSQSTSG